MANSKATILIIDDNRLICKMCQMVLAKAGLSSLGVSNSKDALKHINNSSDHSLILLDSQVQFPNAEEILSQLEKGKESRDIPVILLTPKGIELNHVDGRFPSVLGTLSKPFGPAELLQNVYSLSNGNISSKIRQHRQEIEDSLKSTFHDELILAEKHRDPGLHGQIQKMPLSEILQLLQVQGQTGVFHIQNGKKKVWVFFGQGHIQLATAINLPKEFRLGQVLLRKGELKPSLLERLLFTRSSKKSPLGQVLIAKNYLKPEQLEKALREQTAAIFYEVLCWKKGDFSFEPTQSLPELAELAHLDFRLEGLLLEGYRRVDEMKLLEQEIGSMETVLERKLNAPTPFDQLSQIEKRILQNVNGQATLEEIAERTLLPCFDLYKACQHLLDQDIVKLHPNPPLTYNA